MLEVPIVLLLLCIISGMIARFVDSAVIWADELSTLLLAAAGVLLLIGALP